MKHAVTSETVIKPQEIVVKQACLLKVQTAILCNCVKHAVKSDTDTRPESKVGKEVCIIKDLNC